MRGDLSVFLGVKAVHCKTLKICFKIKLKKCQVLNKPHASQIFTPSWHHSWWIYYNIFLFSILHHLCDATLSILNFRPAIWRNKLKCLYSNLFCLTNLLECYGLCHFHVYNKGLFGFLCNVKNWNVCISAHCEHIVIGIKKIRLNSLGKKLGCILPKLSFLNILHIYKEKLLNFDLLTDKFTVDKH